MDDPGFRAVAFDDLRRTYCAATLSLMKGGADLIMIETVFDTLNAKAAIFAIEEAFDLAGSASDLDLGHDHRSLRADADGADGGSVLAFRAARQTVCDRPQLRAGRRELRPYVDELSQAADTLVSAHPNAGLPNELGGYDDGPESMAATIGEFARSGLVNIVAAVAARRPPTSRRSRRPWPVCVRASFRKSRAI